MLISEGIGPEFAVKLDTPGLLALPSLCEQTLHETVCAGSILQEGGAAKVAGAADDGLTSSARSTALSSSPAFSGCCCSVWLTESVCLRLGGKGGYT